jgi:hypothetical protein
MNADHQLLTQARERRRFAKARMDHAAHAALAGDPEAEKLATEALAEFNTADAALRALTDKAAA